MNLKEILSQKVFSAPLSQIDLENNSIINTLNAHSYCITRNDKKFAKVLNKSDILLPDGFSIVLAAKVLLGKRINKIAGADVHQYLLEQAQLKKQKVFYLGSSSGTLESIENKIHKDFKDIKVASFSPPYKNNFSQKENEIMIEQVNNFSPDILFVGMTAPKQEKWVYLNKDRLDAPIVCSVGAVFDFYAGNIKRAPKWMIMIGMEWLYRLIKEPKRMWKRYLINNTKFLVYVLQGKFS